MYILLLNGFQRYILFFLISLYKCVFQYIFYDNLFLSLPATFTLGRYIILYCRKVFQCGAVRVIPSLILRGQREYPSSCYTHSIKMSLFVRTGIRGWILSHAVTVTPFLNLLSESINNSFPWYHNRFFVTNGNPCCRRL